MGLLDNTGLELSLHLVTMRKRLNIKTKHLKPRGDQKGQVVKVPSPVFSSKAMYYSEDKKAPSKLGRKILEDGTKARFMKKFKETI